MHDDVVDAHSSVWLELLDTSFTYGWVDAGGVRTRYLEAGPATAPPLLLLHGTQGSLETFCRNIGALAHDHRVIAYDLVGSGFSDRPDGDYDATYFAWHLGAVMDALQVPRASFVGVSLGSVVVTRFMADHPERVDRVVLISPVGPTFDNQVAERVETQRRDAVEDPSWTRIRALIRGLVFDDSLVMPDIVAVRQLAYLRPDARQGVANTMRGIRDPAKRDRNLLSESEWTKIATPVLLMLAVDTPDSFLTAGRQLAELLPDVHAVEITRVGHWPHFEEPGTFNAAVSGFLAGSGDD